MKKVEARKKEHGKAKPGQGPIPPHTAPKHANAVKKTKTGSGAMGDFEIVGAVAAPAAPPSAFDENDDGNELDGGRADVIVPSVPHKKKKVQGWRVAKLQNMRGNRGRGDRSSISGNRGRPWRGGARS